MSIVLYSYFRSSAAYRIRIALNLKGVDYAIRTINLTEHGGEQTGAAYLELNPQGLVPALVVNDKVLIQSLAIVEYLEETYPNPPLLPDDPMERAYVRSLAQMVACDIHPLNNLRVLNMLKDNLSDPEDYLMWYRNWVDRGFSALEALLEKRNGNGRFSYGDQPTMADVFLIPQVYNALRYECDMSPYPLIMRIYQHCDKESAFRRAAPENQPDTNVDG